MRRSLAAIALAVTSTGLLAVPAAYAETAAPTVDALEACVQRFPGDPQAAARKACFESALSASKPAAATATPALTGKGRSHDIALVKGQGDSQFRRLWGEDVERDAWLIGEYQPIYFLPAFYARHPNLAPARVGDAASAVPQPDRQATEAKFQFSFKGHIWPKEAGSAHDLWFGYTQVSHWQVWTADASRPFRESSYEPEFLYTYKPAGLGLGDWTVGHVGASLNHNSNGRGGDLSRSWNRVIAFARAENGPTMVTLRGWSRFKESGPDDNPQIEDYYGRADLQVSHLFGKGWQLTATGKHSLRGGDRSRGSLQLDLSWPFCSSTARSGLCPDESLRGYFQVYRGYAESLVDYNHLDTYVGIGFAIGGSR